MFVCTNATTDANIWNNVGEGKDNVPVVWIFQGTAYGYSLGGGGAPLEGRTIEKFSLTTDGNGTNVADLSVVMNGGALGYRSATHGYCTAGSQVTINKFEIASDSDGTNVANLHQTRGYAAAGNSETHGYAAAGDYPLTASIDRLRLRVKRVGNLSDNLLVSIRATDGSGVPTGSDLTNQVSLALSSLKTEYPKVSVE